MFSDANTCIKEISGIIQEFIQEREWQKYHTVKDIALSVCIESAELLELFQWKNDEKLNEYLNTDQNIESIRDEIADIVIYCLDLAYVLGIDVSQSVENKVQKNKEKYPVDKIKGHYQKYTELE